MSQSGGVVHPIINSSAVFKDDIFKMKSDECAPRLDRCVIRWIPSSGGLSRHSRSVFTPGLRPHTATNFFGFELELELRILNFELRDFPYVTTVRKK